MIIVPATATAQADDQVQDAVRALQLAWFKALDHARFVGVKPTWRVGDYYTVDSPSGTRYTIRHLIEHGRITGYTCDCPAAMSHKVCWHRALVAALPGEQARRT